MDSAYDWGQLMNEARELLETGAGWRFFSLLFRCPTGDVISAAIELLDELSPDLTLKAKSTIKLLEGSNAEAAYHVLLGSGGCVSPYESDHYATGEEGLREKGAILGDVAGFYRAFRFDHSNEMLEAPDHIAIELAYMSFLKLKQAYALMHGDEDAFDICCKAEGSFLQDHLLVWIPGFIEKIVRSSPDALYIRAASLLKLFVDQRVISEGNLIHG